MKGRKPKPTKLKLIEGNPGKRALNKNEPKPEAAIPYCPRHLNAEAKREWTRVARELSSLGLLTRIDRPALAAYCQVWGRWVDAENQLAEYDFAELNSQNPHLAIANRALKQMKEFMCEFGMTPSSRSRISVVPEEEEDKLDALLRARK